MSALILKMIKKGESIWLGIDQPPNPFKKYGPEKRATDQKLGVDSKLGRGAASI